MTYGLFFELPEDHAMTRALRRYTEPGKLVMRDDAGMITSVYRCAAGGRFHRTFAVAAFDTGTGTFDVAVHVKPEWRARDLFNFRARGEEREVIATAVTMAQAQDHMKAFEERCATANLPVREGPMTLPAHYTLARPVQDFSRPEPASFASARAALDSLKPR